MTHVVLEVSKGEAKIRPLPAAIAIVGVPTAMGEQVLDQERILAGVKIGIVVLRPAHQIGKLGEVLGHRLVDAVLTLIEEHHHRHNGHRLRHGPDREDRLLGNRFITGEV